MEEKCMKLGEWFDSIFKSNEELETLFSDVVRLYAIELITNELDNKEVQEILKNTLKNCEDMLLDKEINVKERE